jgi:hypothetical protein
LAVSRRTSPLPAARNGQRAITFSLENRRPLKALAADRVVGYHGVVAWRATVMPGLTRRRGLVLVLLAVGAAVVAGRLYWGWTYPHGWSHCCYKALWRALYNYAEEHAGAFPAGEESPEASWRISPVLDLAVAIYDHHLLPSGHLEPARLAVLCDALENPGCPPDHELLHLRWAGTHVRGCWAVDRLLGKE